MYYLDNDNEEPLMAPPARVTLTKPLAGLAVGVAVLVGISVGAFVTFTTTVTATTTELFGASAGCSVDGPVQEPLSIDKLREATKLFVDSLGDDIREQTYYADAALQVPQWQICTIVQQCLVPDYGLAVGRLEPKSRTLIYDVLALVLSDESYKRIMVQQLSNLLLGEMQNWATQCDGECRELDDPSGLLPAHLLISDKLDSTRLDATYSECADMCNSGRHTLWSCNRSPRMLHHGNIDTATGKYQLGNVFKEPTIHARTNSYDFVSVYGSLKPGEPFGFRYSGHHFDLSFRIDAEGTLSDLPTFLGHNPLIVPQASPPQNEHEDFMQWHNMAGVPQFPDAVNAVLEAARVLTKRGYVHLRDWDSTPATGGLTLKGGRDIADAGALELASLDEATWEKLWALIDYTIEFPRGAGPRPEKAQFRTNGRMVWTTAVHEDDDDDDGDDELMTMHVPTKVEDLTHSRQFFYVRCETDELLFFVMVNSLFSLMLEHEPSNHLHSILIPKSYLAATPL